MSNQRSQRRTAPLANAVLIFNCKICDKGYSRQNDFDAHLSSYDHSHRQRMADLKSQMGAISGASFKRSQDDEASRPSESGVTVQRTGGGGFTRIQDLPKQNPEQAAAGALPGPTPAQGGFKGFRPVAGAGRTKEENKTLTVRKDIPEIPTVPTPKEPRLESPYTAPLERKNDNAYLHSQALLSFNAVNEESEKRKAEAKAKADEQAAIRKAEEDAKAAEAEARRLAEEKASVQYTDQLFAEDDEALGGDYFVPFLDEEGCGSCDQSVIRQIREQVLKRTRKPTNDSDDV